MTEPPRLIDPFARAITYLRVSVTDRCDFRCVYCMSEHMEFLPKAELLTLEELDRLCSAFVGLGVEKLRITGGEPLVRKGIMTFFRAMSRHLATGALRELTLTTNGSQLRRFAAELADCGVRRVNVSLDTLDAAKFARITRWGRFAQVMDGIDAAVEAGLKVKINTVALKGVNEDELHDLVAWCGARGFDLTFIEVMPMGDLGNEDRLDQYWSLQGPAPRARDPLDPDRHPRAHRRPGPLRPRRRDRRPHRLHHPAHPQLLRILQPRAPDLHRPALHVPRPGGRRRPARACCAPTPTTTRRSSPPSPPPSPASPRATTSTTPARPCTARSSRHMSHTGGWSRSRRLARAGSITGSSRR